MSSELSQEHLSTTSPEVRGPIDWNTAEPVTVALGRELGDLLDDADGPLWNYVNCDALESLFTHARTRRPDDPALEVSFEVADSLVTVRGDGHIVVRPADGAMN